MPSNVLGQQVRVPSISQAAGSALALQGARQRNLLAGKKLASFEEDRATQQQLREYQVEANAIITGLKSGNAKQANEIYKRLGGKSETGLSITDKDVTVDYGDSTFSGPPGVVAELMDNISKDPTWAVNPKTKAWFAARGGSATLSKAGLSKKKGVPGAVKPAAALKRISDIQKAKATLEKTDMVTQLLAKDNPELAQYIGQQLDPDKKAALMEAWDNELDYLEQFSGTKRKKTITPTGPAVTHTFIPGQGLVPAQ